MPTTPDFSSDRALRMQPEVAGEGSLSHKVEFGCPLRIRRDTRAGCCTWDTFIVDFADCWPRWFQAPPTAEQWQWAKRDWKSGNTGFEAAHNAQRRIKESSTPAARQERSTKALASSVVRIASRKTAPGGPAEALGPDEQTQGGAQGKGET